MKTFRSLRFLFIVAIFFSACTKSDIIPGHDPDSPNQTAGLNESLMLQLVNNQRQAGCNCGSTYYPPTTSVTWNDQLEAASLAHASDMNANNYFDHTGLNGSTPGDRIRNAGYSWRAYGENIAKGYSTEQAVVSAWIASEGHCKNIMNPSFREMGAAKVGPYWVQEFGSR